MNKTNFYGQSPLRPYFTGNFGLPTPSFIPQITRDAYSAQGTSSFEQKLKAEIDQIKAMEYLLNQKIASAREEGEMPKAMRQDLLRQYSLLNRAKKMVALLVEHMQKSMQNIAANFR